MASPILTMSGGNSTFTEDGSGIFIDTALTVVDSDINGALVTINAGFVSAEDRLSFTGSSGITGSFNSTTGVLTLSGNATAAQYQTVLRTVTYQNINTTTPSPSDRSIVFSLGSALAFSDNGHFYEFISASGISWTAAETAAAGRSLFGLQGYLTTITSAGENTFVAAKLAGQGWMGATDVASEGQWKWVTGPEAGTLFWSGLGAGFGGAAVGGRYNNWDSPVEPNNQGGEDYAHFLANGEWNDFPLSLGGIQGYVVEYGGSSGDPSLQIIGTKTVTVTAVNDNPTLTSFAAPIDTVNEDTEVEITLAELVAQGNEADIDGTVDAFVVSAVSSGTLKIGTSAGAATAWAAGSNDTVDATHKAYWTADQDANGTLTAFTVVAKDNNGGLSSGNVSVDIAVTPVDETPVLAISGGNSAFTEDGAAILVDAALTVTDADGGNIDGALVTINGGFVSAEDRLSFTGSNGITGSFNSTTGVLSLSGSATAEQYQTVLRTVTYQNINTGDPSSTDRSIDFSLGTALSFTDNGHFYEFVSSSGIEWAAARDAAAAQSLFGLQGYLTTITSSAENDFVAAKLAGQGWLGASDSAVEGTWIWATGPEAGTQFWSGAAGGSATGGQYNNWATGEPNDSGANEDHGHFLANGEWNDFTFNNGSIQGYVVEFGGLGGDPALQIVGTKTVTVTAVNDNPTLTSFAAPIDTVNEDIEVEITLAELAAQGNEVDVDGTVDAFVVSAVSSGTLKIGTSAGAATAWAAGSNDIVDVTHKAYWTADQDANGTLTAFTVVAKDNSGDLSSGNVVVTIAVTPVNDNPIITSNLGGATASIILTERQAVVTTVTSTDEENDTVTYSLTGGADQAVFSIDINTGVLTFNTEPNFSSPTDTGSDNIYDVQVTATDNGGGLATDVQNIAVEIRPLLTPSTPDLEPEQETATVDGVEVTNTSETGTVIVTNPDTGESTAITTQVITTSIPVVTSTREEEDPNTSLADIPLANDNNGETILQASVPVGVGLSSQEIVINGGELTLREQLIAASEPRSDDASFVDILEQIDDYVPGVNDQNQVTVRTIIFQSTPEQSIDVETPIIINGATGTGEQDPEHPDRQEALIIDVRDLPSGTRLILDNVEFSIIIGAVRVTGGSGQNVVIGDNAAQYIVLGAEDDELHGGGGNDTVGSKGGDDLLFGDEGNDLVVGGDGNDTLEGGSGDDVLQGGRSDAGALSFQLDSDGNLLATFNAADGELAIDSTVTVSFQDDTEKGILDTRIAFIEQAFDIVELSALLFQAVLGRLPTVEEMNFVTASGLGVQELGQLAYDTYLNITGSQDQSIEGQVSRLIEQVWGEQAVSSEIVQTETGFINQGGSWGDVLLFLAQHDNLRSTLLDSEGNLTLTQSLDIGETGWSTDRGNDILRGGDGDDILIGGRGSDFLDGGSGIDIARQFGTIEDYSFIINSEGQLQISALFEVENDILQNIETVVFGNQEVSSTVSNQSAFELKTAIVLSDLINNGTTTLVALNEFNDQNQTLLQLAQSQIGTEGYLGSWGELDNEAFVKGLSLEVLGAELIGEDLQFWVNQLNEGLSREEGFVVAVGVLDTTAYLGDGIVLG